MTATNDNGKDDLEGGEEQSPLDFLRINKPAVEAATKPARRPVRDLFSEELASRRRQLEELDEEIRKLNQAIAREQENVRGNEAALEGSNHARARLLHLRSAMLAFVLELEELHRSGK
jgi:hypothetical protein